MIIRINKEFCKGCGFCIEYCPKHVYELSDELNTKGYQLPRIARLEDCSECGQCDLYCPEFAIVLEETTPSMKIPEVKLKKRGG
jgi:2-oxoglutarate ferredoxin oxidoreductase subunit delta